MRSDYKFSSLAHEDSIKKVTRGCAYYVWLGLPIYIHIYCMYYRINKSENYHMKYYNIIVVTR